MPIRKDRLKVALSTIQKDGEVGYFSPSIFVMSLTNIMLKALRGEELPPIYSFMQYISQDVNNIETITTRLAWQRDLWSTNQLEVWRWMPYAGCDIDLFHIEVRSVFDYLAKVIKRVSDQPKQVPDEGFNVLKTWLAKSDNNAKRLGKDLAELVFSVDWFDDIKNVRDANVHQGGMTLVFLEKDRILFQILKGYEHLVSIPEIMYNENVVDFELYAGMYFGYLIAFLEDFATAIERRLPKGKHSFGAGNPRKVYRELPVIYSWIEKLLKIEDKITGVKS
jgi:hypothetical protein